MSKVKPNITRLLRILECCRPAESQGERDFVEKFLAPLVAKLADTYYMDNMGNVLGRIGNDKTTIFSSHTDTVHNNDGQQKLTYDNTLHHVFVDKDARRNCLGADDGTGIWLMLHMMENKVPGLYIFHREEEIGGTGSRYLASRFKEDFKQYKHCIAFDRKGYTDIITHQGGRRTASDEFATALAKHLPGYKASDGGTFTDSKNYSDIIPECTNLSVGYFDQHTNREYQDVAFAVKLANSLVKVPWHKLPAARDPSKYEYSSWGVKPKKKKKVGASTTLADVPSFNDAWASYTGGQASWIPPAASYPSRGEMIKWVREHPIAAAHILYELGIRNDDLIDAEHEVQQAIRAGRPIGHNLTPNKKVEFQRPADVRTVPAGSKKAVHRPATAKGKPESGQGERSPQRH